MSAKEPPETPKTVVKNRTYWPSGIPARNPVDLLLISLALLFLCWSAGAGDVKPRKVNVVASNHASYAHVTLTQIQNNDLSIKKHILSPR